MTDALILGLASLVALPGLGAFAWAVRQGGRIDEHREKFIQLEKQRGDDLAVALQRHKELMARIDYICERVDTISNDRGA